MPHYVAIDRGTLGGPNTPGTTVSENGISQEIAWARTLGTATQLGIERTAVNLNSVECEKRPAKAKIRDEA